jgi:hypothetical protein
MGVIAVGVIAVGAKGRSPGWGAPGKGIGVGMNTMAGRAIGRAIDMGLAGGAVVLTGTIAVGRFGGRSLTMGRCVLGRVNVVRSRLLGRAGGAIDLGGGAGTMPEMISKKAAGFVELLEFFLGFRFQTGIVVGNPIGMPDKREVFISLVDFFGRSPKLKFQNLVVAPIVAKGHVAQALAPTMSKR